MRRKTDTNVSLQVTCAWVTMPTAPWNPHFRSLYRPPDRLTPRALPEPRPGPHKPCTLGDPRRMQPPTRDRDTTKPTCTGSQVTMPTAPWNLGRVAIVGKERARTQIRGHIRQGLRRSMLTHGIINNINPANLTSVVVGVSLIGSQNCGTIRFPIIGTTATPTHGIVGNINPANCTTQIINPANCTRTLSH